MARLPRLTIPGHPHHVIQRGNNRQPIAVDEADFRTLMELIGEQARAWGVAVHAYVLMGNHFHLLATPETADALPRMMQAVGRRYVRHFNDRHGRTGTLWEGRYKATVVQTERYFMACMVYIDLNPVRAGLCAEARGYRWSSHAHCIGLRHDALVTPHALYWALGNTPFAREVAYADLVRAGVTDRQRQALTDSTLTGWALGDEAFVAGLQKQTERRLTRARPGRPASRKPAVPTASGDL